MSITLINGNKVINALVIQERDITQTKHHSRESGGVQNSFCIFMELSSQNHQNCSYHCSITIVPFNGMLYIFCTYISLCFCTCLFRACFKVFCMCPEGFVLGPDWKKCDDVDECAAGD